MWLRTKASKNSLKPVFLTISTFAASLVGISYIFEFGLNYVPCSLCLSQRYIYIALFLVSLLGYFMRHERAFRTVAHLLLITGIVAASFHTLSYFGFIETKCSVKTLFPAYEEHSVLMDAHNYVPCSEQMIKVFGVPASIINVFSYMCCILLLCWKKGHDRSK